MTVSSSSYFSNSIVGVPQVGNDVDIFEVNTNPKYALGTKFERQDGSVYRYGYIAEATSQGVLLAGITTDMGTAMAAANTCGTPSSSYQMPDEISGVYPGSKGSRYVIVTRAGTTANLLKGGYFVVNKGPSAGFVYRIKGNTALNDPATGMVRIQLHDTLQEAVTTSSTWSIIGCRWNDLIACTTSAANMLPAGWSCATFTTAGYGWVQTQGLLLAYQDSAAFTVGLPACISTNVAGAITPYSSIDTVATKALRILGFCAGIGTHLASNGYATIVAQVE